MELTVSVDIPLTQPGHGVEGGDGGNRYREADSYDN